MLEPRPAPPTHRAPGARERQDASRSEVLARIRAGLGDASPRRLGPHHADVLATLWAMHEPAPDVQAIYKALLDADLGMVMTRLYRALKVLEEAGIVQRDWMPWEGRIRSVYRLVDREAAAPAAHASVCALCGASLSPGNR